MKNIKVFIESYNNVMQNRAGGVSMRIKKMFFYLNKKNIEIKLFDKWEDKIIDCNILHVFKANIDSYSLICLAKQNNKKVVISSVIPIEKKTYIRVCRFLYKFIPVKTTYKIIQDSLMLGDIIVAQTRKEARFIEDIYKIDKNKLRVIPNGVNEKFIFDCKKVKKDIILCVGRFDKNKNQLNIIRALKNTTLPIYFVGGSIPSEKLYYEQCKKEATKNMNFKGWLDNNSDEMVELYKKAKVVVLISHKEIFGNSLLEGAACGANLVATEVLPTQDWGIENCIKVNPNNLKQIKDAIIVSYKKELDCKQTKKVQKIFSWDRITNQYLKIYKNLLEN